MTLTEFLRVRLDEDQRLAQASYDAATDFKVLGPPVAEYHINNWKPARVLAEVDAKRHIGRAHGPSGKHTTVWDWPELGTWCGECGSEPCRELNACPLCGYTDGCPTLRLLALPYADHPQFQPEWLP